MSTSAPPPITSLTIDITQLPHGAGLPLPHYETQGAAGMDLSAALAEGATLTLEPNDWVGVPTGITMAIPLGYEAQIRPRSGLATKQGITLLNAPGTIDSDYRGEVKVLLINHGKSPFVITRGLRIAQMVIAPVTTAHWRETSRLSETVRGSSGFGSTGLNLTGI